MTSSISSSSRLAALAAALAVVSGASGCATSRPHPAWAQGASARVAVFPPDNLTGGPIDSSEVSAAVERAAARAGLELVTGVRIDEFLAEHRIRYTGGIDGAIAKAARKDLDADAVLVTSVEVYSPGPPPTFAVTLRLVSTEADPRILWIDGVSQSGQDTVGLLGLGGISDLKELARKALDRATRSLSAFVAGRGPRARVCEARAPFRPKLSFRLASYQLGPGTGVAVLPLLNRSKRPDAGEVVALHLLRQLAAIPGVRLVEPGVVRAQLLEYRLIMPGGVSLDQASAMLKMLRANLVVSGTVRRYDEALQGSGAPRIDFTTLVLDRQRESVVWESTSYGQGDDGVVVFEVGKVSTPSSLLCAMAGSTVSEFREGAERRGDVSVQAPAPQGRAPGAAQTSP